MARRKHVSWTQWGSKKDNLWFLYIYLVGFGWLWNLVSKWAVLLWERQLSPSWIGNWGFHLATLSTFWSWTNSRDQCTACDDESQPSRGNMVPAIQQGQGRVCLESRDSFRHLFLVEFLVDNYSNLIQERHRHLRPWWMKILFTQQVRIIN